VPAQHVLDLSLHLASALEEWQVLLGPGVGRSVGKYRGLEGQIRPQWIMDARALVLRPVDCNNNYCNPPCET
jgi:hypothetical protein